MSAAGGAGEVGDATAREEAGAAGVEFAGELDREGDRIVEGADRAAGADASAEQDRGGGAEAQARTDGEQREVVGEAAGAEGGAEGEIGADVIADAARAEEGVAARAGEDELGEPRWGRRGRLGLRAGGRRVDVVNDGELVVCPCVAVAVAHASACSIEDQHNAKHEE